MAMHGRANYAWELKERSSSDRGTGWEGNPGWKTLRPEEPRRRPGSLKPRGFLEGSKQQESNS